MGALSGRRFACALVLLVLTAAAILGIELHRPQMFRGAALTDTQLVRDGWRPLPPFTVDDTIVQALLLDDYLYRPYRRGDDEVALYIGFYHTVDKVGAAHDPLVCFQGQGWVVGNRRTGALELRDLPGQTLHYASLVAERDGRRELVVYWFQSYDHTASDTFGQKLALMKQRLSGGAGANAFIRLSTRLGSDDTAQGQLRIETFMQAFYPAFYRYVTGMADPGNKG